jgi:hypothetical protein
MKKEIELLEEAKKKLFYIIGSVASEYTELCYEAIDYINDASLEIEKARWVTPGQWLDQTREMYPEMAPVWFTFKSSIEEKPSIWNKIHWFLDSYSVAVRNDAEIIFCAYNHLNPPPDDWRQKKEDGCERDN